ncbi:TonB-dependent receptor domain-containing protein [Hyphococcus lacteus]|uniref:TonB-dependent receptor n=1 Tax=Hyphococcus lacteus TaxID=3143536 RepID=A0ABV3Z0I6_9PROT
MKNLPIRLMLATTTFLTGVGVSGAALAQSAAADAGTDQIVVTGTRLRSANAESVSPITSVDAAEFELRGTVRAEDLVNALPQVFAAQGAAASNEATGTAQVDLRGLDPSRTLVLVNGRRLPYGSPKSVPSDLNQIPTALIGGVEVLTGGASAVYGSDAIAGVVNFKMIDDFEGLRVSANIGASQHNNSNDELQDLLDLNNAATPGAYEKPSSNVVDGFTQEYSAIIGTNTEDGRGNVTAYATYRKVNPVVQSERDYSSCALGTAGPNGSEYKCGGSGFAFPANLSNSLNIPGLANGFRVDNGEFVDGSGVFNYAPYNYYQRPDERYTLGAYAHYDINDHFRPYLELNFMDDRSVAQIAPGTVSGGINGSTGGLNCDNALFSAQQADYLCGSNGLSTGSTYDVDGNYVGPDDVANGVLVRRRNIEGGPRQDDLNHTSYRMVAGMNGLLAGPFEYDFSASYAKVTYRSRFTGDANRVRLGNALNAVVDQRPGSATFGQAVCAINADADASNDDESCLPLDYFGPNGASAEATSYVLEDKGITGDTSLTNIIFAINGNLGEYGIQMPWASDGVAVAVGGEYRRNTLSYVPDEIYQSAVTPELPISGEVNVKEFFGELNIPIVDGQPFFDLLSIESAYRFSDYSTGQTTHTYKVGANWAPVSDVRFRGSYQRAVRAPNVIELFSSQQRFEVDLTELPNGKFDPCSGATPFATLEQCMNTGVTAAQYGNIQDNPAGQFNTLIGGNPDLEPEVANTLSLGAIITPAFVPGLNVSIDYFDIKVDKLVGSVNPNLSMSNCLATGDAFFCDKINRGQGGSLFLFEDGYFERFNINTGSLSTSGVDLNINYSYDLAKMGDLKFNFVGTYLAEYESKPLQNSPANDIFDCKGLYGGLCGRPRPEWRHKFLTTWYTPSDLSVSVTWRYISSVDVAQTSTQPALSGSFAEVNKTLGSRNYFDLSLGYTLSEMARFRLGVNNVFDTDPPLTTTAAIEDGGNGNTYPQFYDAVGRNLFLGVTLDF